MSKVNYNYNVKRMLSSSCTNNRLSLSLSLVGQLENSKTRTGENKTATETTKKNEKKEDVT